MKFREIEAFLREQLELSTRPIMMAFLAQAPKDVPAFTGAEPSTCSYWRRAAAGETFFTVARDHHNCPIGGYTHRIALPADRSHELENLLGTMSGLGYLRLDEVPKIPQLPETPAAIVYAPLGESPVEPDLVLLAVRPAQLMILLEAARRAGVPAETPLLGRPTCMAIPAAQRSGVATSTGCVGNRLYTDLPEGELYVTFRGQDLAALVEALPSIRNANAALLEYHQGRRKELRRESVRPRAEELKQL